MSLPLHSFNPVGKRLIPHFSENHRGIALQKGFRRWIALKLGTGTIQVTFKQVIKRPGFKQFGDVNRYVNKGSCYKYVTEKGQRSRKDREAFLKKTDAEIIQLVQDRFIQTNSRKESLQEKTEAPQNKTVATVKFVLGTYNVLFPQPVNQQKDKFNTAAGYSKDDKGVYPNEVWRLDLKTKNIINANPDSLALQEVTEEEFKYYQKALHGYVGVFSGAHTVTAPVPHGVAIFYKSDKYRLLAAKKGHFEGQRRNNKGVIQKTPRGMPVWARRTHLLLDLQEKASGAIIRVVSCHLIDPRDWMGEEKAAHTAAVVKHAKKKNPNYKVDLVAVCGDMNQDQFGDDPNKTVKTPVDVKSITAFRPFSDKFIHDKSLEPTEYDKKKDDYNSEMKTTERKIDWIFVKKRKKAGIQQKPVPLKHAKITSKNPDLKPNETDIRGSDHVLTMTEIDLQLFN